MFNTDEKLTYFEDYSRRGLDSSSCRGREVSGSWYPRRAGSQRPSGRRWPSPRPPLPWGGWDPPASSGRPSTSRWPSARQKGGGTTTRLPGREAYWNIRIAMNNNTFNRHFPYFRRWYIIGLRYITYIIFILWYIKEYCN